MMNFLIQTIGNKVTLDYAFQLERNIEFLLWKGEKANIRYCELDEIESLPFIVDEIPVGTIDFVLSYLKTFVKRDIRYCPINVPIQLIKFRDGIVHSYIVDDCDEPVKTQFSECYVKSMENIKANCNGKVCKGEFLLSEGIYQITKIQNIVSEWRTFVNNGEMLDCRCYDGDFTAHPDYNIIKEMIDIYDRKTPYTLDVFVNDEGKTQILEVHDFWSCGLYGFSHPGLAHMMARGYYELRKEVINN